LGKGLYPIQQVSLAKANAALRQAHNWNSLLADKMVERSNCQSGQLRYFVDRQKFVLTEDVCTHGFCSLFGGVKDFSLA